LGAGLAAAARIGDYVFVTPDLVPRLRSFRIDAETQASDHQPVVVEFA
jgi:exonuclease III